jgi:hypothetical protein
MSPLLRLPAELRLQIYEHHYSLPYERLPFPGLDDIQIYWPRYTLPSGLALTNHLIYTELQGLLRKLRKSNTPDLALRLPLLFPLTELLSIVENVANQDRFATTDACLRRKYEVSLASLVEAFARKNFNKVQKRYEKERERTRWDLEDRARPTDGLRMTRLDPPQHLKAADLALLQNFVRKTVLRMRNSCDFTFRVRVIVSSDEEVRAVKMGWVLDLNPPLQVPSDFRHGMRVDVSLARKGGWGEEDLAKMEGEWPRVLVGTMRWVEATEVEGRMLEM